MKRHETDDERQNEAGTGTPTDRELTRWRSPTVRTLELVGFTYFIKAGASIKIGAATNFKHRLQALQTAHEKPLEVLAVVPAAMADEYAVHQLFAHLRQRGEWFRADRELLNFIEQLKVDAAPAPVPEKTGPVPSPALDAQAMVAGLINLRTAYGAQTQMGYACSNLAEIIPKLATYQRPAWATYECQTLPWRAAQQMKRIDAIRAAIN